eukprot:9072110-Alexandrium_andersonii.AAC.1
MCIRDRREGPRGQCQRLRAALRHGPDLRGRTERGPREATPLSRAAGDHRRSGRHDPRGKK